ncbi:hypothetical protein LV564_07050 [Komagataeibacter nataicola]|uniref:hypothetical protein n=1 Tax=Komagataeibacter nataicola TaxID=265960 RepID=UPI001428C23F|nr:hypothetical protein [Komagataeibacter nataicola]WEQ56822.1 hypothetical protein LV564_07050 [Komagataeibacter nataicola]WNM08288.1 hypothetical protein RI056_15610 [Komagataeibacter nataicola]
MTEILPIMEIKHHIRQNGNLAFLPEVLVLTKIGIKEIRFFLLWYCHVFLSITISWAAGDGRRTLPQAARAWQDKHDPVRKVSNHFWRNHIP